MDFLFGRAPDLGAWEGRAFSADAPRASDARDRYTRTVAREPPGAPIPGGPFARVAEAILAYRVFEPGYVRGVLRRAPLELGDTVGIHFVWLPGVTLFFAARVVERFDEPQRAGFTYRTLEGHPELGEETFEVTKDPASGEVTVELRAWSRPGLWYTRAGAPLVRALQKKAGRGALAHLAGIASEAPLKR